MTPAQSTITEIKQLHFEIVQAARSSIEKAIRIGEILHGQRRRVKHGEWLPWVKEHLPFTDRTARNYLRVYENRERLKLESVSDLTDAYRLLESPRNLPAEPAPEFMPLDDGTVLDGTRTNEQGETEQVHICPSTHDGFHFVALVTNHADGSATVDGISRPIRRDHVWVLVEAMHVRPKEFEWERKASRRWDSNIWLGAKRIVEKQPEDLQN